jgi:hypothetical protein
MTIYNTTDEDIIMLHKNYKFMKDILSLYNEAYYEKNLESQFSSNNPRSIRRIRDEALKCITNVYRSKIDEICLLYKLSMNWEDNLIYDKYQELNLKQLKKILKSKLGITKINKLVPILYDDCPVCLDEENATLQGFFKCCHNICSDCHKALNNKICPICRSN